MKTDNRWVVAYNTDPANKLSHNAPPETRRARYFPNGEDAGAFAATLNALGIAAAAWSPEHRRGEEPTHMSIDAIIESERRVIENPEEFL